MRPKACPECVQIQTLSGDTLAHFAGQDWKAVIAAEGRDSEELEQDELRNVEVALVEVFALEVEMLDGSGAMGRVS